VFDLKRGARGLFAAWNILALLAVLAWHTTGPLAWERPLIHFTVRHPLPGARLVILAFEPIPFVIVTAALAWMAWTSGRVRLAIAGAAGSIAALAINEDVLKPMVARHHPFGGSPVFPSGHVTAAAACAMFAWFVFDRRPWRWCLAAVPVLAAWAVVSMRVHYPADAIGGLIVGASVVSILVVRPVGALARLADVVRDAALVDVHDLRDVESPRRRARADEMRLEVRGEGT